MRKQISIALTLAAALTIGHLAPAASAGVGADVSVSASLDPTRVEPGVTTQLTVTVENEGDAVAGDVQLAVDLPDGLDLSDVLASVGTCDGFPSLVCDLGDLDPGDVETVVLELVPSLLGDVTLIPTVTSLLDTDPTNDAAPTVLRVVQGGDGRCTIRGTGGDDTLRGTGARDVICGRAGNDRIRGLRGNDILKGGAGRDRLMGGPGRDRFVGGPGRDRCRALAKERTRSC